MFQYLIDTKQHTSAWKNRKMKRNDSAKECQIMNKKNILVKMVPNFMKTIFQEMHRSTGMITQCDT